MNNVIFAKIKMYNESLNSYGHIRLEEMIRFGLVDLRQLKFKTSAKKTDIQLQTNLKWFTEEGKIIYKNARIRHKNPIDSINELIKIFSIEKESSWLKHVFYKSDTLYDIRNNFEFVAMKDIINSLLNIIGIIDVTPRLTKYVNNKIIIKFYCTTNDDNLVYKNEYIILKKA
jgi:hypothetical protein